MRPNDGRREVATPCDRVHEDAWFRAMHLPQRGNEVPVGDGRVGRLATPLPLPRTPPRPLVWGNWGIARIRADSGREGSGSGGRGTRGCFGRVGRTEIWQAWGTFDKINSAKSAYSASKLAFGARDHAWACSRGPKSESKSRDPLASSHASIVSTIAETLPPDDTRRRAAIAETAARGAACVVAETALGGCHNQHRKGSAQAHIEGHTGRVPRMGTLDGCPGWVLSKDALHGVPDGARDGYTGCVITLEVCS